MLCSKDKKYYLKVNKVICGFPKSHSSGRMQLICPTGLDTMKESIHLNAGLLGHVCQHELFKCIQILNMSNTRHEKFKWLNTYGFVQFQWLNKNSSRIFIQANQSNQLNLPKELRKTYIILLLVRHVSETREVGNHQTNIVTQTKKFVSVREQ